MPSADLNLSLKKSYAYPKLRNLVVLKHEPPDESWGLTVEFLLLNRSFDCAQDDMVFLLCWRYCNLLRSTAPPAKDRG